MAVVWVVGFEEALPCPLLVLRYLLLGMALHFLVRLDVTWDAKQFDVAWIVCQSPHLFFSLGALNGSLVVAINTGGDEALTLAALAQTFGSLPHQPLDL